MILTLPPGWYMLSTLNTSISIYLSQVSTNTVQTVYTLHMLFAHTLHMCIYVWNRQLCVRSIANPLKLYGISTCFRPCQYYGAFSYFIIIFLLLTIYDISYYVTAMTLTHSVESAPSISQ